ncbi:hypothetical protein F4778DRAFT_776677 [Xylariomycetidae sp. FL2044]|nr:hypothetical protein F4778DRAFT_776677 [Xylariomycetidae sp. FL2044]
MQFSSAALIAILSYTAVAVPVNEARNTPDSCQTQWEQCVTLPDANRSTCGARQTTCNTNCQIAFDSCDAAGLTGCADILTQCTGELAKRNIPDSCQTQWEQCVTLPDANRSTCGARQTTCNTNCQTAFDSCDAAGLSGCADILAQCTGQ